MDKTKKHLEKVYNKIFEGGELNEEGKNICAKLNINPADLVV